MARSQQSIQAFGRISKVQVEQRTTKKRKASLEVSDTPAQIKDRKKRCINVPQTPAETPTKAINRKLAGLELAKRSPTPSAAKRNFKSVQSPVSLHDTPPTSPCPSQEADEEQNDLGVLLEELDDFRSMNTALLTSLSLHYAHHGTVSPLDLRRLTPSITKLWGKRKVDVMDIKRCLGLLETSDPRKGPASPFQLFDYGNERICVELQTSKAKAPIGTHFDEERLNDVFDQQLRQLWAKHLESDEHGDVFEFLAGLPLASVKRSPNASKTAQAMSLARGQKRLEEVLGAREDADTAKPQKRRRVQVETDAPVSKTTSALKDAAMQDITNGISNLAAGASPANSTRTLEATASAPALSRAESLFERIRAKQLHAATLPAAPTKDQILRNSALHRVEEIMDILNLLVAARGQGPRASFPLQSLTQSLQSSLRSPMARDEVERSLGLMETEVAPRYVKILKMGSVSGVVVDTAGKPKKEELRERLRVAGV